VGSHSIITEITFSTSLGNLRWFIVDELPNKLTSVTKLANADTVPWLGACSAAAYTVAGSTLNLSTSTPKSAVLRKSDPLAHREAQHTTVKKL